MKLYSIGESAIIQGMERGKLKGWFDGGFIKATKKKKWGKGTKKLCNIEKQYEIKWFHKLTNLGFSRETASKWINKILGYPFANFSTADMIRLKQKGGEISQISMSMGRVHLVGDKDGIKKITDTIKKDIKEVPLDGFDEVVFMNIKEIRNEVDQAIKKFESK